MLSVARRAKSKHESFLSPVEGPALSSTMVHHDEFRRYVQHDCFKFIQGLS